jgi:hypothetical protein
MASTRYVRNSETEVWRDCRLKWYLSNYLGFLSEAVNPNFWLGTFVHFALSEWYLGRTTNPAHLFWWVTEAWLEEERGLSVQIDGVDFEYNELSEIEKYQELGIAMLEGYVEWAKEQDDFAVIDSELAYFVDLTDNDGRPFTFAGRLDLLGENSEGIRAIDFKTCSDFRDRQTVHTYQQFRRYPWILTVAHPDWADEVAGSTWVGLRKITPSARSKPPYFASETIDLTPEEIRQTGLEFVAEVTDMLRAEEALQAGTEPRDIVFPNPRFDCSWKCGFFKNGLCQTWRAGGNVHDQGRLHGTWGNDPYAEYKKDDAGSVLVSIGRREGGD